MKFSLTIDRSLDEGCVDVTTPVIDDTVRAIEHLAASSVAQGRHILAWENNEVHLLDTSDCLAFYTQNKAVWVHTLTSDFVVKMRLYELENTLPTTEFARISHSEIVNISAIAKLDLSLNGTLSVVLKDGMRLYVSRRQLSAFKRKIGM
ncbi:LytTR family DNA-binding domain-containing protein [Arcanobacterium phocae]|uniref:LytTR family DNA-binding domain-containing protein n=1 Tax=Arcanobacterium phocae TaxID=131112 RepID=UPI001C0F370C|nr:LytTR family DNA-binding domain-containing protein [Arcanobacterium phocae]